MPVFSHDYLHKVASHIYRAEGASDEEARIVANHQVKANLVGHDSHGVILLPVYVERIRIGHLIPGAPFVVEKESPTTACINGNWGFGFVVTEKAMGMAIEKARANNVAAITVYRQSHIGRLGDYATMAAEEGMIGLITADSGAGPKAVAPFGGRERRLGTNSICIGAPRGLEATLLLDMATGGAILPVGADQGHKGSGMSFMVEMFSGILTGLGFGIDPQARHNDGCFLAVFNVEAFRPLEEFKKEARAFAEYIKDTPPAKGFTEVLYPGEIEWRTEQQRREVGIYVEDETWDQVLALVRQHGLETLLGQG